MDSLDAGRDGQPDSSRIEADDQVGVPSPAHVVRRGDLGRRDPSVLSSPVDPAGCVVEYVQPGLQITVVAVDDLGQVQVAVEDQILVTDIETESRQDREAVDEPGRLPAGEHVVRCLALCADLPARLEGQGIEAQLK